MHEEAGFFERDGTALFGVLHRPDSDGDRPAFVLCYPFQEEKLWVQRVFVNLARHLARRGHAALRFDYAGHGDSEGDFEASTVETRLQDIAAATAFARERTGARRVGLIGQRFGATLAALAAERDRSYSHVVLWDPILRGQAYMQETLRLNLTTQLAVYREIRENRQVLVDRLRAGRTVNIDGYELCRDLYDQACAIDLTDGDTAFEGKVLIVQTGRKPGPFSKGNEALRDRYRNAELTFAVEEPFWREIRPYTAVARGLQRATVDWLEANP